MTPDAMTHRQVVEAMSGLMLGMFVAILSSTVVSTSLPHIINDLGGTQSTYTWVVTSTLLAVTVTTPIWGKLSDLFDRKLLVQVGLSVYVIGSMLAGLAQSSEWLIACRVLQGLGVGGLTALTQVILSDLVSPRERGRYAGYLGAVFGLGTVLGPLLGGLLTDSVGWRGCFYVGVPFGVVALVLLQRTLNLPRRRREVSLDYTGATLIAGGLSSLLVWVSLAGNSFDWLSAETAVLVTAGAGLLALAVRVERRAKDPLIPLRLLRDRTVVLAVVSSASVGVALFGSTVFLTQYMQLARDKTATESGLLTIPLVVGLFVASTIGGRIVTRSGHYKRLMMRGAALLTAGLALMGTMDETTSLAELAVFMLLVGSGLGLLMQNLVLVVQNSVDRSDIGAASALVAFVRTLGGAAGVSVLGAVLAAHAGHAVPQAGSVPPEVRHAVGTGVAELFLTAAPFGLVVLIALSLMRERPLGRRSGIELARAEAA
jgi:EmrB/QacA subfamily drug resistance transporter